MPWEVAPLPDAPRRLRALAPIPALAALAALVLLGGCDVQKSFLKIPVGGFWQRLTPAVDSICFYPDWRGDRVLFTVKLTLGPPENQIPQDYRVGVVRSDGTGNKVYPGSSQWSDLAPRWVNDSLVVFYSNRSGSYDIWYLNLNSGAVWNLAPTAGTQASPAPRPGTPGLAFVAVRTGSNNLDGRIALIPDTAAAFSDVRYLSPDSLHAGEPDWDPTGTRVCFSAAGSDPVRHVWLATINGSDTTVTQLTNGAFNDVNPRMSPDGTRVAFVSPRSGQPGVWVVSIAGESAGVREVATEDPGTDLATPAWSPDGHALVASSNGRLLEERFRQQVLWLILNANP